MFENLISSTDDQLLVENKSVSEDYSFECSCKLESRLLPRLLVGAWLRGKLESGSLMVLWQLQWRDQDFPRLHPSIAFRLAHSKYSPTTSNCKTKTEINMHQLRVDTSLPAHHNT